MARGGVMQLDWKVHYQVDTCCVPIVGLVSSSKEECTAYLADRVATRLARADGTEELRRHIMDLEATGFALGSLLSQVEASPKAKDWEIGEALAEAVLEDRYDALFPWPCGLDKRSRKASLPGADLVGLQRRATPRFVFGQVKSSSETRVPPQVVDSATHCLKDQMAQLLRSSADRQQLISWLLVRARGTDWEAAFNEALQRYAQGNAWLVGVLVSGKRDASEGDLECVGRSLDRRATEPEVGLVGLYIPFHKSEWADIIYSGEAIS